MFCKYTYSLYSTANTLHEISVWLFAYLWHFVRHKFWFLFIHCALLTCFGLMALSLKKLRKVWWILWGWCGAYWCDWDFWGSLSSVECILDRFKLHLIEIKAKWSNNMFERFATNVDSQTRVYLDHMDHTLNYSTVKTLLKWNISIV